MTKSEALRQTHQQETLRSLGFTLDEANSLRRISMTLQRWHELECGTGDDQVSVSIERDGDESDSKPFKRVQYQTWGGKWVDKRYPVADRETGARKRLAKILSTRNIRRGIGYGPESALAYQLPLPDPVSAYIQTDPRGAALYILRPGDVPEGEDVSAYYSRGICVY